MEDTCKEEATRNENLVVKIKTKKRPRFKAGAELSGVVNLVAVDINETADNDSETLELSIQIQRSGKLLPASVQD